MAETRRHWIRQVLPGGVLTVLLGFACAAPLATPPRNLPPLVQPATSEHLVGRVIWVDLVTPNLAAAVQFCGGLFGWTFHDIHTRSTDYAVALLYGRSVAGMIPAHSISGGTSTGRVAHLHRRERC